jgi:hypothetical protein
MNQHIQEIIAVHPTSHHVTLRAATRKLMSLLLLLLMSLLLLLLMSLLNSLLLLLLLLLPPLPILDPGPPSKLLLFRLLLKC